MIIFWLFFKVNLYQKIKTIYHKTEPILKIILPPPNIFNRVRKKSTLIIFSTIGISYKLHKAYFSSIQKSNKLHYKAIFNKYSPLNVKLNYFPLNQMSTKDKC